MPAPITWTGEQVFRMVGTSHHEDTLKVLSNYPSREHLYRLRLPTLCITYADMDFANRVGGEQMRWPDSAEYGPAHFDPPVVITGEPDIRRLTWIRGAHQVEIGPRETEIAWLPLARLVVPRLRIRPTKPVDAVMIVDSATIDVEPPLNVDMVQYADGRPVGGVRLTKRHPDWKDREPGHDYDLWIKVVDFASGLPMVEARILLHRWDERRARFVPAQEVWTDGNGSAYLPARPVGSLEAATLAMDGRRATATVWRAQPNQTVNQRMTATALTPVRYPSRSRIDRQVYAATYSLDPGDTVEWLARRFAYASADELVDVNDRRRPTVEGSVALPGWYFLLATDGDTLDEVASTFDLPRAWPRTVGRHHRPRPDTVLTGEAIAVPSQEFIRDRSPDQD